MIMSGKYLGKIMLFCWLALLAGWSGAAENSSKKIVVATDDNYPPYVFRDIDGQLKGYLIDAWALWSQKTGIAVDVQASDWILAQQRFGSGEADVLDTVFDTPERQKTMSFSPPYADLPVQIFVHQSIQGIDNTKTLKAFSVGVKAGDACIDRLSESGVVRLDTYPSYEVLSGPPSPAMFGFSVLTNRRRIFYWLAPVPKRIFVRRLRCTPGNFTVRSKKATRNCLLRSTADFRQFPAANMKLCVINGWGAPCRSSSSVKLQPMFCWRLWVLACCCSAGISCSVVKLASVPGN